MKSFAPRQEPEGTSSRSQVSQKVSGTRVPPQENGGGPFQSSLNQSAKVRKQVQLQRMLDESPRVGRDVRQAQTFLNQGVRADSTRARAGSPRVRPQRSQGDATPRSAAVQLTVENATYNDEDASNRAVAEAFFVSYDTAVQAAFRFAITVPSLGPYRALNGYTESWYEKWTAYLAHQRPKLMAATFGYVIESLVSDPRSDFCPAAPAGYSVTPQVTEGGTRPDLVLRLQKGDASIAWLDLTASGSVDHIYDKEDWSRKVGIFAEVTYPSLDPGTLSLMVQNRDNEAELSEADFAERMAVAQAEYEIRKRQWLELGKRFAASRLGREIPRSRMEINLDPGIPRDFIRQKLAEHFGVAELGEKMVPSILSALGVAAGPWGYTMGFSQSEKAGEAWLVDHEPAPEEVGV